MNPTDTSEHGLESLIVNSLVDESKYVQGEPGDYDRDHAVDLKQLFAFLEATQPDVIEQLGIGGEGASRSQFLHRLQGEIAKRGVINLLRKGFKHGPAQIDLFYGTPTPGNKSAEENYAANIFSITRQLRYSKDETALSLDMCIFINGLPVITFELKNQLTKQTYADAIDQYKRDRSSKELLFQFGRCMVHFALDDQQVWMCTHLKNGASWFLPFNKGYNDDAGNPPNPNGLATDYLWKQVLAKDSLTNIIENYAQIVEEKDKKTGRKKRTQIFPRYHQLDVVRSLLADSDSKGTGHRYLIQHSAGSGKSNSITWLAHQLIELQQKNKPVFDSVIVVTDRRVLDKQIRDNIKQFAQVSAVVGAVTQGSGQLKSFISEGKRIIITTVQKFPFILKETGDEHRGRTFGVIIDEAHSTQGGRTAAAMNIALAEEGEAEDETNEDRINRVMESRKMLSNASYFAFTATPKNKTLQVFGAEQTIDMDSYRAEIKAKTSISLADDEGEVEPVPTGGGGFKAEPELDRLSSIVRMFNENFGNTEWKDQDKIIQVITEEIPAKVAADSAYKNACENSDQQNARLEHDKALGRVMTDLLSDHTELFKLFSDNPSFKKWLTETNFNLTYNQQG